MFSPETLVPEAEKRREHSHEQEMFLENMLQMAWFDHRYAALGDAEKEDLLKNIRQTASSGEEVDRIDRADEDERKEIALEWMILSPSGNGGEERKWYRETFLPSPEGKRLLSRFEDDPEEVARQVDELFRKMRH